MNWLLFICAILATYRLSLMVSKESGPMRIFRRLRNVPPPKSSAREGLQCPLCTSVWFSAAVTCYFIWLGFIPLAEWPLWWLAFSGGAVLLHLLDKF